MCPASECNTRVRVIFAYFPVCWVRCGRSPSPPPPSLTERVAPTVSPVPGSEQSRGGAGAHRPAPSGCDAEKGSLHGRESREHNSPVGALLRNCLVLHATRCPPPAPRTPSWACQGRPACSGCLSPLAPSGPCCPWRPCGGLGPAFPLGTHLSLGVRAFRVKLTCVAGGTRRGGRQGNRNRAQELPRGVSSSEPGRAVTAGGGGGPALRKKPEASSQDS